MYEKLRYEIDGPVGVLTFNDPATLNAASFKLAEEMLDVFGRAAHEVRCLMISGEGRGFCSGANLAGGLSGPMDPAGFDAGAALETHYNPVVCAMRDLAIPLITVVNGPAAGVGCSFALLGDLIIAGQSAYFLQAFRRIGLVPDGGSTYMLVRAVGRARAMEMMMLGEKIPAAQALEWGLINRVVPDTELKAEGLKLAHQLASGPTKALAMIRQAAWASFDNSWSDQLTLERQQQRIAGRTGDSIEGVMAFLQKRPANFTGQ